MEFSQSDPESVTPERLASALVEKPQSTLPAVAVSDENLAALLASTASPTGAPASGELKALESKLALLGAIGQDRGASAPAAPAEPAVRAAEAVPVTANRAASESVHAFSTNGFSRSLQPASPEISAPVARVATPVSPLLPPRPAPQTTVSPMISAPVNAPAERVPGSTAPAVTARIASALRATEARPAVNPDLGWNDVKLPEPAPREPIAKPQPLSPISAAESGAWAPEVAARTAAPTFGSLAPGNLAPGNLAPASLALDDRGPLAGLSAPPKSGSPKGVIFIVGGIAVAAVAGFLLFRSGDTDQSAAGKVTKAASSLPSVSSTLPSSKPDAPSTPTTPSTTTPLGTTPGNPVVAATAIPGAAGAPNAATSNPTASPSAVNNSVGNNQANGNQAANAANAAAVPAATPRPAPRAFTPPPTASSAPAARPVIADPQLNIQTAAAPTAVPGAATGLNVQARPAAPANPANNGGASNSNAPLRVSGEIQTARLIRRVTPTYPPVARAAKIQGTVRFAAVINKEGHIDGLKLVSGPAPLVGAASEAVKQWQYQPTLVNGRPVEVETQITVDFKLN